ncbi:MAG: ribosome small subunit-dependent GTPase A [Candidatus Gastranaerophilales bacterium]|nr:ribosome small subunit-dependent GTPase A [Candidatus Gastranaerophilales bacterium]
MQGYIIKIHSDFYYVKTELGIIECKLREIIKKSLNTVFVGDNVIIDEFSQESNQAVISKILERKNHLNRPSVANIDTIIVVMALKEPSFDFIQLDRYLSYVKINNINAVLCINKEDLGDDNNINEKIFSIYKPLGYKILLTSALTGEGLEKLKNILKNKRSVFCGLSGVGKSSLLNKLNPEFNLRICAVGSKSLRGTHTTRHVEILDIGFGEIADTPGFSNLKFNNVLPNEIKFLFDDIQKFADKCHYYDCLHLEEEGCNVLLNLDKISQTRYESYKAFVQEAFLYKDKIQNQGYKKEQRTKKIQKGEQEIKIVKLGIKAREKSRKKQKQDLNISNLDDAYYNNDINLE